MRPIDRLKRDHATLRAKLQVIESALRMGEATWFVLRELCHSLAAQLRDHIRREDGLIAQARPALGPELAERIAVEHREEPRELSAINRLFVNEPRQPFDFLRTTLHAAIRHLRQHLDDEEARLFPLLNRLGPPSEDSRSSGSSGGVLHEAITVNRVLHEHPRARAVFDRLFVSVPFEGCDCLDEVAWRHGLESRALLEQLDQAIGAAGSPDREAGRPAEAVCQ